MFTEKELREKGAKRACLEYILSEDPTIPVPETVAEEDIGEGVIVRSDHWREFDAFEGIFESVEVGRIFYSDKDGSKAKLTEPRQIMDYMHFKETGIPEVDMKCQSRKEAFERYCKGKGLDPAVVLAEFKAFPQRKIDARVAGTIFAHPNIPGRYLLYMNKGRSLNQSSFFIDKDNNGLRLVDGENLYLCCDLEKEVIDGKIPVDALLAVSPVTFDEIGKIVHLYDKVHSLPKFQDGFVHMMEFTFDPDYVLQMRRFRIIEDGTPLECPWKDEEGVSKTNLTFGLTKSPEGIVLPYAPPAYIGGIPQRCDWLNTKFFDFAEANSNGFAYRVADDHHTNVILPNAVATLDDNGFCSSFSHGTLANMAHMPVYMKMVNTEYLRKIRPGSLLRIFSKGSEGYIKVEETSKD